MPEQMNLAHHDKITVDLKVQDAALPVQDRRPTLLEAARISSYLVFFNGQRPDTETAHRHIQGQITFAQPILGVIYNAQRLIQSDAPLGLQDISYPQSGGRGLVCKQPNDLPLDSITIAEDGHTILFDLYTVHYMDQFRVIVNSE